jgi:hypothetical protein
VVQYVLRVHLRGGEGRKEEEERGGEGKQEG